MPSERLQKIIAAAGIASRRKAEELITAGHVKVNGAVVTELGTKADADVDHIRVDGKLLQGAQTHVYLLLNKPKGYVTTVSDPEKLTYRDATASRRVEARLSGRSAGLCERGLVALNQRRHAREQADEGLVAGSENFRGEGCGNSNAGCTR